MGTSITAASATAGATTTAPAAGSAAVQTGQNALQSLSGNFSDFLKLLMTQLQNQDPSSPMDSSQFTTQLVQFASVEQQINANGNLTQLIQLQQGAEMTQSAGMVGKKVQVSSDHLALQNGTAEVDFNTTVSQPVEIGVYSDSGVRLRDVTFNAGQGANSWTWNGQDDNGNTVPDGSYRVIVEGGGGSSPQALDFTVAGTVTGVTSTGTGLPQVQLGPLSVAYSAIRAVD